MIYMEGKNIATPNQALEVMQRHTEACGVFIDLDRVFDYQSHLTEQGVPLLQELRNMAGNPYLVPSKTEDIAYTLRTRFGMAESAFKYTETGKASFNAAAMEVYLKDEDLTRKLAPIKAQSAASGDSAAMAVILDTAKRSNEAILEFLNLYSRITSISGEVSRLKQYTMLPLASVPTFDGHRMAIAKSNWSIQTTGRLGAQNPSILNVPAESRDIVTYPAGWILLRADSGQIEPRITYSHYIPDPYIKALILAYGDAYYGILHYVTDSAENIMRYNSGDTFEIKCFEITDELKAARDEIKVCGLAGNYGSTNLESVSPRYGNAYTNRIVNNPYRLAWLEDVKRAVYSGEDSCFDYFGREITPEGNKRNYTASGWANHLRRCFINNPIQGTAARFMCESVVQADRAIATMSKQRNSFIAYYEHDKGAFYVREGDDQLFEFLSGCTSYQYENWIFIPSEVKTGISKPRRDDYVSRL